MGVYKQLTWLGWSSKWFVLKGRPVQTNSRFCDEANTITCGQQGIEVLRKQFLLFCGRQGGRQGAFSKGKKPKLKMYYILCSAYMLCVFVVVISSPAWRKVIWTQISHHGIYALLDLMSDFRFINFIAYRSHGSFTQNELMNRFTLYAEAYHFATLLQFLNLTCFWSC